MSYFSTINDKYTCCICHKTELGNKGTYITPHFVKFHIKDSIIAKEFLNQFDFEFICNDCEYTIFTRENLDSLLFKIKLGLL